MVVMVLCRSNGGYFGVCVGGGGYVGMWVPLHWSDVMHRLTCYVSLPLQVKAKIVKLKKLPGVVTMKVKAGKTITLKCESEKERATWIGLMNAPVGFIPTKKMIAEAQESS